MVQAVIDDLIWEMIVDRLHKGMCVPFLGAAANIRNDTLAYPGLPIGEAVAAAFAKKLKYEEPVSIDLARIALEYEVRTDRAFLLDFLGELLDDSDVNPSPLLETLAALPVNLIVTTNYDCLLERALELRGARYETLVQPADGFEDTPETEARFQQLEKYDGTLVYKIHGTFRRGGAEPADDHDDPTRSPLIITEDDYIDFLSVHAADQGRIGVPNLIRKNLTPSTLLFLGYSLQDWDFRAIYGGIIGRLNKHQQRRSFAIQHDPPPYWVRYWEKKGVAIYDMDIYDFARELSDRYSSRYGGEALTQAQPHE